jgi:hypothetical protein
MASTAENAGRSRKRGINRPAEAMVNGLIFVERVRVPFVGEREGSGPLTEGQRTVLHWTKNMTTGAGHVMHLAIDLPDGAAVADVGAAFAVLLARHEMLRTTYDIRSNAPDQQVQRVARTGELPIDVYEVKEEWPDCRAAVVQELADHMRVGGFRLEQDLPLRVSAVTWRGTVATVVLVISHLAFDLAATMLMRRQLLEMVADPDRRAVGPLGHQPLDKAADEYSPAGRRQRLAALRHWETQRRRMPAVLYSVPMSGSGERRKLMGRLSSHAAALAMPHVTARTGVNPSAVMLTNVAAVMTWRTGHRLCPTYSACDNRTNRKLHDYLGALSCDCLALLDVGTASFDELARQTATAALTAARHSYVDVSAEEETKWRIEHERGVEFARDTCVNNLARHSVERAGVRVEPLDGVRRALDSTALHWQEHEQLWQGEPQDQPELLFYRLFRADTTLDIGLLTGDTRWVPRQEIESLLRGIELLLVAAAGGDVDLRELGGITGVRPVVRGSGWHLIDSCWVDVAAVQRLLDDVLDAPTAAAFAVDPGTGAPELVAYLVPGARIRTPEQAHAACVAGLYRRFTAMAPRQYVFCAAAPEDPRDLAAWRRQPVLARGSGRLPGGHAR